MGAAAAAARVVSRKGQCVKTDDSSASWLVRWATVEIRKRSTMRCEAAAAAESSSSSLSKGGAAAAAKAAAAAAQTTKYTTEAIPHLCDLFT